MELLAARERIARVAVEGSLDEVIQATLDTAEALTGSTIGFFHFVEENQSDLTLQCWSTNTLKNMCNAEGKGAHYPIDQAGVWVDCVKARRPVIHDDYESLPHKRGMPAGHARVLRELVVPVLQGELVVAIVGVGNKPTSYDQADVEKVETLARLCIDLVARKRAEARLRASEERFRKLFESSKLGIVYQDATGAITEVNPAAEQILGLTADQLRGRTSSDPRWRAIREDGSPFPGEEHPAMVALSTGRPVRDVSMGVFHPTREAWVWLRVDAHLAGESDRKSVV